MHSSIVAPVVALVAWSLVMLVWTLAIRAPALKAAGIDIQTAIGSTPGGLEGVLPDQIQWKSHNYTHLMEQPTLFYAICLVHAVLGSGGGLNTWLAWAYVGLRVAHSLIQVTTNIIRYRVAVFVVSTLVLMALTLRAAIAVA